MKINYKKILVLIHGGICSQADAVELVQAQNEAVAVDAALVERVAESSAEASALRAEAYPAQADYLDAIVKGDVAAQDAYVASCLAVKAQFPKIV